MKNLLKVLGLLSIVLFGLTACGSDDVAMSPKPDARISVVVSHGSYTPLSTPAQNIVVDANSDDYYRLRINIDNSNSSYDTLASLAIDSLNGTPTSSGLLTQETVDVTSYQSADLNLKLTPGTYTLVLEGNRTEVNITVNPHGTTPSPATTVAPA